MSTFPTSIFFQGFWSSLLRSGRTCPKKRARVRGHTAFGGNCCQFVSLPDIPISHNNIRCAVKEDPATNYFICPLNGRTGWGAK
ncbi:hypothetical protein EDB89DRAFT_1995424 [Lactarius sanguifluus]|nr:hypothetical protein EDB89DRAFT_1995424 [Lactarius sanguifluus]